MPGCCRPRIQPRPWPLAIHLESHAETLPLAPGQELDNLAVAQCEKNLPSPAPARLQSGNRGQKVRNTPLRLRCTARSAVVAHLPLCCASSHSS